jgi:hypothetical protein
MEEPEARAAIEPSATAGTGQSLRERVLSDLVACPALGRFDLSPVD